MDELDLSFLIAAAYDVGRKLLSYCDTGCSISVDARFAEFANDVNVFARESINIQLLLQDPTIRISDLLSRLLGHITHDVNAILSSLHDSIQSFENRCTRLAAGATQHRLLRMGRNNEVQKEKLYREFLGQANVYLERSQMKYAGLTMGVVLVVLNHAKASPSRPPNRLDMNNELRHLTAHRNARAHVAAQEGMRSDLRVRVTMWLQPLPESNGEEASVFDVLAQQWAHPVTVAGTQDGPATRRLEARLVALENSRQEDQDRIQGLENGWREGQRRIIELKAAISELLMKVEEDRKLIYTLKSECRDWERRCTAQGATIAGQAEMISERDKAIRDMRDDFGDLEGHNERQRQELRRLKQEHVRIAKDNQRLATEVLALNEQPHQQQAVVQDLTKTNSRLRRQRDAASEAKHAAREAMEHLKAELEQVRISQQNWQAHAERLKDQLAPRPNTGPTSFRDGRRHQGQRERKEERESYRPPSSRRGSGSSGSSTIFVRDSSRDSSTKGRRSVLDAFLETVR